MKIFLISVECLYGTSNAIRLINLSTWLGTTLLLLLLLTGYANGQSQNFLYPPGFSHVIVADGFYNQSSMAFAPDGRIFVTEQTGKISVIKNGSLLPTAFVQLNVYAGGEAGLNGIAIDPNFATNGYIYVYYTVPSTPQAWYHNRISRFTASGDVAVAGSETIILELDPSDYAESHNGGSMEFGVDGKLYVGVGDSAYSLNAQNLDTYKGKILRINPDGSAPVDNPFPTGSEQRKRIWAYGLRNPFSFDIQPGTGRILANDVGEGTWEEINDVTTGGLNFGWPNAEGASTNPAYTNPIYAYTHIDSKCAVVGGAFFNPATTTYPASYIGKYFYLDYCTGLINTLDLSGSTATSSSFSVYPSFPVYMKVGPDGNLYFLARYWGALYKIIYTTNTAPNIVSHPTSVTVPQSQPAQFSVTATGTAPLSYQWQKDGMNITGATSATYAIASTSLADAGQYQVVVSNAAGSVTSNPATLSVTAPNQLPTATILSPTNHTIYTAGDVINFSGSATDPEDGVLPASAFTWTVEFHHNVHYHPGPAIASGITSGQFTIPTQGETATDVFYRLILTVTDSRGGTSTTSVDIDPHLVTVNLATNPPGLTLNLDGQPFTTPYTRQFVSGIVMGLNAPVSQTLNNTSYTFNSWTLGPDAGGTITIPNVNTVYTANYTQSQDLAPIIYIQPSTQYGTTNFTAIVDVYNLTTPTIDDIIRIYITKDPLVNLTFNAASSLVGGRFVQNNLWTFDETSDPNFYVLTTKQSAIAGNKISFGLNGLLTPGNTKGTLTVSTSVTAANGPDMKVENNTVVIKVAYFDK